MADGNEGQLRQVLSLDGLQQTTNPLEYYRDSLGLSNKGANPGDKEFELIVSRQAVDEVFTAVPGGRGYLIRSVVDEDGNPDEGMVQFAQLMLEKVYGIPTSKKRRVGLAFVRGLIADRRYGLTVDWASFAFEAQFKRQRADRNPKKWNQKRQICPADDDDGDDEEEEDREVACVKGEEEWKSRPSKLRQCFRMYLEDRQNPTMDLVYQKELEKRAREESHEEQVSRAKARELKVRRHLEDAQSCVQHLERRRILIAEEREQALRLLDKNKERSEEVAQQTQETRERHDKLQRERRSLEKKLQDVFEEKKVLNPENGKDEYHISQLKSDMEFLTGILALTAEQTESLATSLGKLDNMKKLVEAEQAKSKEMAEQAIREHRDCEKQLQYEQAREERAATLLQVRALITERYKEATDLSVVPRAIPQATDYPEDLRLPETLVIKPCPVCERWFHCLDFVGASCGCLYHVHCLLVWFRGSERRCCRPTCGKRMHPDWLTAWGKDWDSDDEKMDKELGQDTKRAKWKQDSTRSTKRILNRPETGQRSDGTMSTGHRDQSPNRDQI